MFRKKTYALAKSRCKIYEAFGDDEAHVMGDKRSIMKFMLSEACQKTMFLMFIKNSKKKQSKKETRKSR